MQFSTVLLVTFLNTQDYETYQQFKMAAAKLEVLELELEVASIQMLNKDDSRRGKKQFCLFESPVVLKVKIEFLLEVVGSCTFQ